MAHLEISQDRLHLGERFAVSFQRTLRIPDNGRTYPLPPGLGRFPIYRVADFADRVPPEWHEHGGVFIAMYQREALWLGFHAAAWKPILERLTQVKTISERDTERGEPSQGETSLDVSEAQIRTVPRDDARVTCDHPSSETAEQA